MHGDNGGGGRGGTVWYGVTAHSLSIRESTHTHTHTHTHACSLSCLHDQHAMQPYFIIIYFILLMFDVVYDVVHLCIMCDVVNTVKSSSVWPYEAIMPLQLENGLDYRFCKEQNQTL